MLHGLEIHFESFEVYQKQFWPFFDHHLSSGDLFSKARVTLKFITQFQIFLVAELLHTVAQRYIFLDVN